jgi:GNAT superfamily N-acetyltransferase
MITIVEASLTDLAIIKELAYKIWPYTYGSILSDKQIDFMLAAFYSDECLKDNVLKKGHRFLLLKNYNEIIGFAAYENNYLNQLVTRVHKLYMLPETHGKGFGKLLLDRIATIAIENKMVAMSLNVNRFNTALLFYQKLGFIIVREENIELDQGYLMEDYVMEKSLLSGL